MTFFVANNLGKPRILSSGKPFFELLRMLTTSKTWINLILMFNSQPSQGWCFCYTENLPLAINFDLASWTWAVSGLGKWLNPLPHYAAFWHTKDTLHWKTLWEKQLLLSSVFSTLYGTCFSFWMHFKMSSAICFSLDQSKILSSGNSLTVYKTTKFCFDQTWKHLQKTIWMLISQYPHNPKF